MKSIIISIVLFVPFFTFGQSTNFSGKWFINISKSELGNTPVYAAVKHFEIRHVKDSIFIKRVTINANNEENISLEVVRIDGKAQSFEMKDKRIKTNTMSWSQDDKVLNTLTVYSNIGENKDSYTLEQSWQLVNGDKQLVINLKSPIYSFKAIYDRQ